jgi:hypothetical protein
VGPHDFSRQILSSGVPERAPGTGDGVSSPDGWKAKSGWKRETGSASGPNFAIRMKKTSLGDLVGETSGDALTTHTSFYRQMDTGKQLSTTYV